MKPEKRQLNKPTTQNRLPPKHTAAGEKEKP
jgi:hypothetical protein